MAVVRNILVRVGGNIQPLQQSMSAAQRTITNFRRVSRSNTGGINSLALAARSAQLAVAAASAAIVAGLAQITKEGMQSAIKFEAASMQVSRYFGSSTNDFMKWANSQAIAFNMSKTNAVQYGAVYGNLISGISTDQRQAMNLTVDLLKKSAIVASGTGRTMEDVMERIRSGLLGNTEAIEDLGVNVNVALLQSTEAFKKFANGKSWDQLDFKTQQQIRLMAIMEQVNTKFGNTVSNNTASALQQLSAILDNVQLSLGQAFLPILNQVIPILSGFANWLGMVTTMFSQFMNVLFGTSTAQKQVASTQNQLAQSGGAAEKSQDKLGKAAKKAGDKAKGALASFDEINQLQDEMSKSASGAGDAIGGTGAMGNVSVPNIDMSGISNIETPKWISDMAESIRTNLQPAIDTLSTSWISFKTALDGISPILQPLGDLLLSTLGNYMMGTIKGGIYLLSGALETLAGTMNIIKGIVTGDFTTAWKGLGQYLNGIATATEGTFMPILNTFFPGIDTKLNSFRETALKVFNDFGTFISETVIPKLVDIWNNLVTIGSEVAGNLTSKLSVFQPIFSTMWDVGKTVLDTVWQVFKDIGSTLSGVFSTAINAAKSVWNTLVTSFNDFLKSTQLKTFFKGLSDLYDATLKPVVVALTGVFEKLWQKLTERLQPACDKIKTIFGDIHEKITGLSNYIKDTVISQFQDFVTNGVNTVNTGIKTMFDTLKDIVEKIGTLSSNAAKLFKTDIPDFVEKSKTAFSEFATKAKDAFKEGINGIISSANYFIRFWNKIKLSVPQVSLPFGGTIGGFSIGVPQIGEISALASGGITTKPMLAMIGDNPSGNEAVLPLDNTSVMDSLGSVIANAILGAMSFNSNNSNTTQSEVVINIDGTKLARVLIPKINKENNRIGNTILNLT